MAAGTDMIHTEGDITTRTRLVRAITALAMVGYPMVSGGAPIGIFALLPLIAIYPMYTAVVGWDPVKFLMEVAEPQGRSAQLQWAARFVLVMTGIAMIGATLTISGEVGWYGLLALFAIVPVFIAIMGENPVDALRDSSKQLRDIDVIRSRQAGVSRHGPLIDETADGGDDENRTGTFSTHDKAA